MGKIFNIICQLSANKSKYDSNNYCADAMRYGRNKSYLRYFSNTPFLFSSNSDYRKPMIGNRCMQKAKDDTSGNDAEHSKNEFNSKKLKIKIGCKVLFYWGNFWKNVTGSKDFSNAISKTTNIPVLYFQQISLKTYFI